MQDADLKKIADMVTTVVDNRFRQFKGEITEEFRHQISIQREGFQHKLDLIAEGHQLLSEKLERVESGLGGLGLKIDKMAAEVAAHRADTEAHHGVYRVKEG